MVIPRTPWRCGRVPVLFSALLVVCAACTAGEESDAADQAVPRIGGTATRPGPGTTVPSDTADVAAPEPPAAGAASWTVGDTNVERRYTGAALLGSVRTARHEGFDRVVLDFGEGDVPGYRISYIDRPVTQCGSGETVPLAGDAWLSIRVQPANAHTEEGRPTVQERERAPRLPALLELKLICDFEAVVEWAAGVASPAAYRAFVLAAPTRLVVDIQHPD